MNQKHKKLTVTNGDVLFALCLAIAQALGFSPRMNELDALLDFPLTYTCASILIAMGAVLTVKFVCGIINTKRGLK